MYPVTCTPRSSISLLVSLWLAALGTSCIHAQDDAHDPDAIVITEPLFFQAPTNTLRYVISGYDDTRDLCISAVWFIPGFDDPLVYCDDFEGSSGYLVIAPGQPAGCFDGDGNAQVLSARGCVDWAEYRPGHTNLADLEFEVVSDLWTGTVIFDYSPR